MGAMTNVVHVLVTGSPMAAYVDRLIDLVHAEEWTVCVVASPDGRKFIDAEALEAKTGYPVRSEYKRPGDPDAVPPPAGLIVAPLTCNSLAKWAAGISDTLPLGLLVEGFGRGLPIVAVPAANKPLISFPAVQAAIRNLSDWGVTMLVGDDVYEQPEPGGGAAAVDRFPWARAWETFKSTVDRGARPLPPNS